jgi:hypothetical protein
VKLTTKAEQIAMLATFCGKLTARDPISGVANQRRFALARSV